jgi:methionyl-tRNA formyltransferase
VTKFRGQVCKILRTAVLKDPNLGQPGSIMVSKGHLAVACGDATSLEILSIQPQSRKAISGADFANGLRVQPGEKFESLMDN